jgi:hypothetical protein
MANPIQDAPGEHTGTVLLAYVDAGGLTQQISAANPLPTTGGGGGGGGATGSVTAAGVNGTAAQAVQGINGGIPLDTDVTASGTITGSSSLSISCVNRGTVAFQVTGTWVGSIVTECTINGTDWISTTYTAIPSGNSASTFSANTGGQANVAGFNAFRLRAATISSGTASIAYVANGKVANVMLDNPLPTGSNTIGSVTGSAGAALALASNQITGGPQLNSGVITASTQRVVVATDQPAIPVAGAAAVGSAPTSPPLSVSGVDSGGLKRHLLTDTTGALVPSVGAAFGASVVGSSANEASRVIKASAGTLISLVGYNAKTAAQFILLFNSTTVPADTTAPVYTFTVPASSNFSIDVPITGIPFTTGIAVSNSSTQATKTLGSADCWFTAVIK